jgi:hypothetical protein
VIPSFTGQRVTTVSLDYLLRFFTDAGWQFDLEGDVELYSPGAEPLRVDKAGPGTPLPQLLESISGQEIRDVRMSESGDLEIALETMRVVTRADPNYETWQVYGPEAEIIVGGPGGRLTTWGIGRT